MKKLGLILIAILPVYCFSQTGIEKDTISNIEITGKGEFKTSLQITEMENKGTEMGYTVPLDKSIATGITSDSLLKKLNIYTPSFYVGPTYDYDRIYTSYPFERDYAFYNNIGFNFTDRLWLSTGSTHQTLPAIGGTRQIGAMLNYKITDNLIISGGTYGAKYNINNHHYNDLGFNGRYNTILPIGCM